MIQWLLPRCSAECDERRVPRGVIYSNCVPIVLLKRGGGRAIGYAGSPHYSMSSTGFAGAGGVGVDGGNDAALLVNAEFVVDVAVA